MTSIRCADVSISSFVRSSKLVPPAMNFALPVVLPAVAAAAGEFTFS
ncbi:hypothetical protein HNR60_001395 [Rhodopseudomonas rhenobacensis]|uniref:Uncharacterized protein n=1 Tax=Rhodopseudomonas rhenobacensis TaxID=87461 RepID=A0A7W7Z2V7_9BRAD|nr:hypothetical protein [Rhodopseudomonas rhenobacensis]